MELIYGDALRVMQRMDDGCFDAVGIECVQEIYEAARTRLGLE